jgi:hypothetical protein
MASLPFSVTLLALITVLVFLGLGQRVLDHMRLTDLAAVSILVVMIIGHFLPTISLSPHLAVNFGGVALIGVAVYLLATTSVPERNRAIIISLLTSLLVFLSDKLLPLMPGLLDPVYSGGIFAGLLAVFLGRSRRSAFIAGILGVLLVDLANFVQLQLEDVQTQITLGSGGLFSSAVIGAFMAVVITEIIGEIREKMQAGGMPDE